MSNKIKRLLIGRPMKMEELSGERLGKFRALAILSSDALSSVAYGTEQILLVLIVAGAAALWYSIPISIAILGLLTILILSYRQTIYAYQSGGGAYIVAKDNIGVPAGLVAGSSLLVDYILTVAVSSSAGTDAITSAFPHLIDYRILISLLMILTLTLLNLRGITESATIFMIPVYLFVVAIFFLIAGGIYQWLTGGIHAVPPPYGAAVSGVTLFFLLKAFSSGCAALTGVEAVSNAIPNFREPAAKNAVATLIIMGVILGGMFFGTSILSYLFGIIPQHDETVVSQLADHIFGRGSIYYFIQITTAMILFLAANTAYAAFPLLAFMLAKDKFMPTMFMHRGDRLGFSNGIIILGLLSSLLVILANGHTTSLIPLYAIGVFIPFTLSQAGMMRRWWKLRPSHWYVSFIINGIGMLTTLAVTLIFFITKLKMVWMVFILIPAFMYAFLKIRSHYHDFADELKLDHTQPKATIKQGSIVIIPVATISKVVENTIDYAKSLTDNIIAVHVGLNDERNERIREEWAAWGTGIRLVSLHSPYRSVIRPLVRFIEKLDCDHITVAIPQFVTKRWWHQLIHNQTTLGLRAYLLTKPHLKVVTVPYFLQK